MKALREHIKNDGHAFRVSHRKQSRFPFAWHFHPEYELTLITRGQGQRIVGDDINDYGPSDLVLLGPDLPHTWSSEPERLGDVGQRHEAVVIQFLPSGFGPDFFQLPECKAMANLLHRASCGLDFGKTGAVAPVVRQLEILPELDQAHQLIQILDVLRRLASIDAHPISSAKFRTRFRHANNTRVDTVCDYVATHFHRPLGLKEIAAQVSMNESAFCRFFKQATGRTLTTYINEQRVIAACRLLRETEMAVTQVGFEVGYQSHPHFNRQFNKFKLTSPGKYRSHLKMQAPANG